MERKTEKNESLAQIKDIAAGCFAGAIAKVIEYPFDTIKVLCQINQSNIEAQSTLQITRNVLQNEGILRIYRGLSAPLIGSCVENLIVFWLFGSTERYFKKAFTNDQPLHLWQIGVCAAAAGTGNTLWICPVEFIKCQMQASHTAIMYENSTLKCFIHNITRNPLQMFDTNALIATGCREIPGSVIWFSGYKVTTRALTSMFVHGHREQDGMEDSDGHRGEEDDVEVPSWIFLCGGGMAGLSYWTCCYPFDLIKSIIQTEQVHTGMDQPTRKLSGSNSQSFWKRLYTRYRMYGFVSLYNGFSVTIPRAIISNAAIFMSYEYCRMYLDRL
eukprot:CAMPEP_0197032524 /NCGR_PEP_ID=MMETSP1384-20130603/11191_1 /TAXON_ID=29189 /ORGANISM="Ammonia sp." /LENGTH=328 /DNA_ID=CAMNT_0042462207 /DNA_START=6 /DNA_END=992 /DNA_ORIENTATION=+